MIFAMNHQYHHHHSIPVDGGLQIALILHIGILSAKIHS
jgi:hypothetical protein